MRCDVRVSMSTRCRWRIKRQVWYGSLVDGITFDLAPSWLAFWHGIPAGRLLLSQSLSRSNASQLARTRQADTLTHTTHKTQHTEKYINKYKYKSSEFHMQMRCAHFLIHSYLFARRERNYPSYVKAGNGQCLVFDTLKNHFRNRPAPGPASIPVATSQTGQCLLRLISMMQSRRGCFMFYPPCQNMTVHCEQVWVELRLNTLYVIPLIMEAGDFLLFYLIKNSIISKAAFKAGHCQIEQKNDCIINLTTRWWQKEKSRFPYSLVVILPLDDSLR